MSGDGWGAWSWSWLIFSKEHSKSKESIPTYDNFCKVTVFFINIIKVMLRKLFNNNIITKYNYLYILKNIIESNKIVLSRENIYIIDNLN